MKGVSIVLLLNCCFCVDAFALHPASGKDYADLQKTMFSLQLIEDQIKEIRKNMASDTVDKAPGYEKQIQEKQAQEPALCRQALKQAQRAYDIHPKRWAAPLYSGPEAEAGDMARFDPKFGDLESREYTKIDRIDPKTKVKVPTYYERTFTNSKGESITDKMDEGWAGKTWDDGQIELFLPAFLYGPGMLGAMLLHETMHWEHMTTPIGMYKTDENGKPVRKYAPSEEEDRTFAEGEKPFYADTIFQLTAENKADMAERRAREVSNLRNHGGIVDAKPKTTVPPPGKLVPADDGLEREKVRGDGEFVSLFGDLEAVSMDAVDTFKEQERQRRAEEIRKDQERKREEEERRRQALLPQMREDSARDCGFEEYTSRFYPNLYLGFHQGAQHAFYFPKDSKDDPEVLIAQFALARACLNAANDPAGETGQPCGSGFELMKEHWAENRFRYNLYLSQSQGREKGALDLGDADSPYWCVHDVINKTKLPFTMDSFRQSVRQYKKEAVEYRKNVDEARRKWRREHPDPRPDPNRGNGGGGGEHQGGGGGYRCPENCQCVSIPWTCTRPASPL